MDKPKLFLDYREFFIVIFILLLILIFRLVILYDRYSEFISKPFYYTQATVLLQYNKKQDNDHYRVLKLQDIYGKKFYTITYLSTDLSDKIVRVKMYPNETISFFDYLGVFFVKTKIKVLRDRPLLEKDKLLDMISSQHQNQEVRSFYQAIFLATTLSTLLRDKISGLGVSHLVALSGFHLTILWGLIYGLSSLLYKPLQQRWFAYRMMLFDMGIVTLAILGVYLWFVDFPPSLVRSYAMLSISWIVLLLGIELISFELLGFVVMLLLALFPNLIASYGFYFSVVGVFYIYLLLYWYKSSNRLIYMLYIPIGIFILMLPIIHGVFGMVSPWQLLSPILSLSFVIFYPLAIALHLIGYGDLLDTQLLFLFDLPTTYQNHILPIWVLSIYILLSLFSMVSLTIFRLTFVLALGYAIYIFGFIE